MPSLFIRYDSSCISDADVISPVEISSRGVNRGVGAPHIRVLCECVGLHQSIVRGTCWARSLKIPSGGVNECNRAWLLKNSLSGAIFWVSVPLSRFLTPHSYAVAGRTGVVGWLRNRTRRLMF